MTEKRPEDATDSHSQEPAIATQVAPISANTGNDLIGNIVLFLLTCGISISYFLVLLNSTVVVTVSDTNDLSPPIIQIDPLPP